MTNIDVPRSDSPAQLDESLNQDTSPPLLQKVLSPNQRAVEVFRQANLNQVVLPMAQVLSNDFEYHDLSVFPTHGSRQSHDCASHTTVVCPDSLVVRNKEQYLQWKAKSWDNLAFSRIVEVHQMTEAGNIIVSDDTVEYRLKISPRTFQRRNLTIYEFESPLVEPDIGNIHRIKGMTNSGQQFRNTLIACGDQRVEQIPFMGQKRNLKALNEGLGRLAADLLGFSGSQPGYSPLSEPESDAYARIGHFLSLCQKFHFVIISGESYEVKFLKVNETYLRLSIMSIDLPEAPRTDYYGGRE
ncbi:hypothetical protein BDP27DRAFT_1330612 [Rhodocollybia butyracea]|uniref:Uncharacterized protein n=1 Tax=Rhodocollybia butyracea TaxID=206335 RepID=A0A9P5PNI4_9AGAR|nr:hypothetical protein BDP27DRAFT_1330612 [Rhodocollybia butyracea]